MSLFSSEEECLLQRVFSHVEKTLEGAPSCHDFAHTLRVFAHAKKLLEMEKADKNISLAVHLSALLHDIARPQEMASEGKVCHAALGGKMVPGILRSLGVKDETLINTIANAVSRHRFRGKNKPENEVDRILYDADKLDSIGAVGIGRAFHFAGRVGAALHNTKEEALASPPYGKGDTAYREYLVKLQFVPERMLTESGKLLAKERKEYMDEFFRRMDDSL